MKINHFSLSVTTNSCSGLRSSDELVRDLSFKIQFFVCSCLELTIAPETNDSYGTYALGLDRISDGVRVTILEVAEEDNERATPWVLSLVTNTTVFIISIRIFLNDTPAFWISRHAGCFASARFRKRGTICHAGCFTSN